jgi:hypothetical protein
MGKVDNFRIARNPESTGILSLDLPATPIGVAGWLNVKLMDKDYATKTDIENLAQMIARGFNDTATKRATFGIWIGALKVWR